MFDQGVSYFAFWLPNVCRCQNLFLAADMTVDKDVDFIGHSILIKTNFQFINSEISLCYLFHTSWIVIKKWKVILVQLDQ